MLPTSTSNSFPAFSCLEKETQFAPVYVRNQQDTKFSWHTEYAELIQEAKIAIIDDEPINIEVVKGHLEDEGYAKFYSTSDSTRAIEMLLRNRPDVVLLDLMMPKVSGLDLLASIRSNPELEHLAVIILTACSEPETKLRALQLGSSDFLAKPVDPSELMLRLRNVLVVKKYQDHLEDYSLRLQEEVSARTAELVASREQIVHCLAMAAEFRDDDTGQHVARVGRYAAIIAEEMGFSREDVSLLGQAAQLHDIGKIGVPDDVLLKEGKLEPDEFDRIKKHCSMGKNILKPMSSSCLERYKDHANLGARLLSASSFPLMKLAAVIAQTHHEKYDGSGYPLGLAGEDIPIEGRIVAVADVFDALSSERPYKPSFPREKCFEIMEEGRGKHFDPAVLDAFFKRTQDIIQTQILFAEIE